MKKIFLSCIFTFCALGAYVPVQANLFGSLNSWFGHKPYSFGGMGCFLNGYVDRNAALQNNKKELSPSHPWRQLYIYKMYEASLNNMRYSNVSALHTYPKREAKRDRILADAKRYIAENSLSS